MVRLAKQTKEKEVFLTELSCQGSVIEGTWEAEIAWRGEDIVCLYGDVAGEDARPVILCQIKELCLYPKSHKEP